MSDDRESHARPRSSGRETPTAANAAAATRPVRRALVVVRDVLAAGLVGALADAEGWTAVFPCDGEPPERAIERLAPALALVDGFDAAARAPALYATARQAGTRVVLFVAAAPWDDLATLARHHPGVTLVAADGESLGARLRAELRAE